MCQMLFLFTEGSRILAARPPEEELRRRMGVGSILPTINHPLIVLKMRL